MPTYDYKCSNCSHQFETYQSIKDEALKKCPRCGSDTLKRLVSTGGGIIFKGSGFYLTDYKNTGKPEAKADSKSQTDKIKTETKTSASEKTLPEISVAKSGSEGK